MEAGTVLRLRAVIFLGGSNSVIKIAQKALEQLAISAPLALGPVPRVIIAVIATGIAFLLRLGISSQEMGLPYATFFPEFA